MKMYLYTTSDLPNVINKTLSNELEIDINLKSDIDIVNPEIVLNGDFRAYNYAHIPDLNRYYIIQSLEQLNLKFVKLNLTCDVLETYKNEFMNHEYDLIRESKSNDVNILAPSFSYKKVTKSESNLKLDLSNNIVISTISVK